MNFILATAIYFIVTLSFSIELSRLWLFIIVGFAYTAAAIWMLAYTLYGNFSRVQLEISGSRFQLKHWWFGKLTYNASTSIKNIKIYTTRKKISILPFDRARVIIKFIGKPSIFLPLVQWLMKFINNQIILLPLVQCLQHHIRSKIEVDLADRQYALALLLTPAENQWLASELTIFLDRALRRQQIYRDALDWIIEN